jgi:hypothetical protein
LIFYDDTDDIYLLDIDDDGIWDYEYDLVMDNVSKYLVDDKINQSDNGIVLIGIGILIGCILIIGIIIYFRRTRKK